MDERDWLADRFEEQRPRLKGVAYRMLGSLAEADDAVQETWLRLSRAGGDGVVDLGAWLTTVVARVCLNVIRSRNSRREESIDVHVPDGLISREDQVDPEYEAVLADSVGLALQVVLDTLTPAERLAFVMHDMFDVPFDDIASMVGRTPDAARQLASRARRRVHGVAPTPDPNLAQQRAVVDAFFAAARAGDFDALVQVLAPDVVARVDAGAGQHATLIRGVQAVAKLAHSPRGAQLHRVLVNGTPGAVITMNGRPFSVLAFTVVDGKIVQIDGIRDRDRVRRIAAAVLPGAR
jgi:RNA polymerase sigma factor (sigma-70 family)